MRLLVFSLLIVLMEAGYINAQVGTDQASLYAIQSQMLQRNLLAWQSSNFEQSIDILREMRDVTASRRSEFRHLDVPDIDFILRDMEKVQKFTPDQLSLVKSIMAERRHGNDSLAMGDYAKARNHFERLLQIATPLFEDNSFLVIDSKLSVARALALDDKQESFDFGVSLALDVRNAFERQEMTNLYYYRHILDVLTKLYFKQGNFSSAVDVGEVAVDLYVEHGAQGTGEVAMLTGVVAESFNQLGMHKKALEYTSSGLNNNPPLGGLYGAACIRLLLEYTRAKIALEDFENVGPAFDKLLEVSDQFAAAGYSHTEKRIEIRKEYIKFLDSQGDSERVSQLLTEINRIELRAPLQKSRFSEE